jgi:hypothetical protein
MVEVERGEAHWPRRHTGRRYRCGRCSRRGVKGLRTGCPFSNGALATVIVVEEEERGAAHWPQADTAVEGGHTGPWSHLTGWLEEDEAHWPGHSGP